MKHERAKPPTSSSSGGDEALNSNGWPSVPLREICERVDYGFTASADFSIKEPRFLRITDIQNGSVMWDSVPGCKISDSEAAENRLEDGDIVFARTGATTGKSFLICNPPKAVFASYLIRLRLKSGVSPEFISLFLQSEDYWKQIREGARGGIQPNFNATMLGALSVLLPPLSEQRRIADRLCEQLAAVATARAAAQAQLDAAKVLPAGHLRAVFNGKAVSRWPTSRLVEVSEITGGVTLGRDLRGRSTRPIPYLRVANVKDGWLDLSHMKEVEATEQEIRDCRLRFGDLVVTEGGDPDKLGRGTFWQEDLPECIHQNHIFRVRFDLAHIDPAFVAFQFGSPLGKAYFLAHAKQTTGIATINRTVLSKFPLLVPPLSEQRIVSAQLEAEKKEAASLTRALTEKLTALAHLCAALLREAFRGNA